MTKTIVIFSILFFLFAGRLSAQTPAHINYQAALRNTETGVELSNQQVFMVVKFLNGGPDGDIVYQEEHDNVSTTLYGIINIQLGDGQPVQGNFNSIPWASGDIWLDLEVDAGKGLQSIGTTKFSSVPYALYAADTPQSEPDGDGDSTNEIQDLLFSDNVLTISQNDNATPIDFSGFVNTPDDDSDPTNEIQDITLTGNELKITGNPAATSIDLTPYVNVPDEDSDPTNELITSFDYNPVTAIISITEGGITRTQDLSTLVDGGEPDADSDPTNEIQDLSLTDNNLKITANPDASDIDLSPYVNVPNLDNDPSNEIQDLSFTEGTLKITGNTSATDIDLSGFTNVPNLDNDPANEIQDLSLSGNNLSITGNPDASDIDLSPYVNVPNLDNDPANEIQDLNLTGTTLKITGNSLATNIDLSGFTNVPNLDNDPENEIQDLNLTGTTLKITGNASATNIDLSGFTNVPNLDNDSSNEIQDLLLTGDDLKITGNASATVINLGAYKQDLTLTGNTLKITGNPSATNINLSPYVNVPNLDNDPANEIQDLNLTGTTLKITGNASASDIDLSGFTNVPNLDNDPANEIQDLLLTGDDLKITGNASATVINLGAYKQDLTLTGNTLKITGNPSATNINLSPYVNVPNLDNDPANEIQDLNLTGTTLKITGNTSATNIDLSGFTNIPNLDNNPTNEIQDLSLTGNTLKITGNPSATNINLSPYVNVPNLDNDPANEIQDLSFSGNVLSITGNASATNINLSQYQNPALPQGHIFVGNASNVATPQQVTGDISLSDDGDFNVNGLRDIPISTTAPTDGQVLMYNSGNNTWEPVDGGYIAAMAKYYSVDPMDFVELHDPNVSSALNRHNGLKFFNKDAPFAMLRNEDIRTIGAPVHLPHGAVINQIKFYIKDASPGIMFYSLIRKQLTNFSNSNTTLAGGLSSAVFGNSEETLTVSSNNVVNNQLYTYRIIVTFSQVFYDDNEDDPTDVQQAVYGAVIRYTN